MGISVDEPVTVGDTRPIRVRGAPVHAWPRWIGLLMLAGLMAIPGHALAGGSCGEVSVSPEPGWPGAEIIISGTDFTPGSQIFVNFGGSPIGTTTSTVDGAFSLPYTIPNDFPAGTTNVFAFDGPANCEDNPSYTVGASPPTTTTAAPATTTTASAATTTAAVTATTAASTTSAGTATTTTAAEVTTTATGSTTTAPESTDDDGGSSGILLLLVGALLGAGLLGAGLLIGRRMGPS